MKAQKYIETDGLLNFIHCFFLDSTRCKNVLVPLLNLEIRVET